jgi:hypothetical protein
MCLQSARFEILQRSRFWLWYSVVVGITNISEESVATAGIPYLKIQQKVLQIIGNNLHECTMLLPRGPQVHFLGNLHFFSHVMKLLCLKFVDSGMSVLQMIFLDYTHPFCM